MLCLMQPSTPLALFVARAHCWLLFNLVSTMTPRALFVELFSNLQITPKCPMVLLPTFSTLHFSLLYYQSIYPACFISLTKCLLRVAEACYKEQNHMLTGKKCKKWFFLFNCMCTMKDFKVSVSKFCLNNCDKEFYNLFQTVCLIIVICYLQDSFHESLNLTTYFPSLPFPIIN